MVILIVDQYRILALKRKREPPVSAHLDGPVPAQIFAERMEFPSRSVHVVRGFGTVKREQLHGELRGVLGLDPRLAPSLEEPLDSGVAEGLDHAYSVTFHASVVKRVPAARTLTRLLPIWADSLKAECWLLA